MELCPIRTNTKTSTNEGAYHLKFINKSVKTFEVTIHPLTVALRIGLFAKNFNIEKQKFVLPVCLHWDREFLKILQVIIRFEENKNFVNIKPIKNRFMTLRTTAEPVFFMAWQNCVSQEDSKRWYHCYTIGIVVK